MKIFEKIIDRISSPKDVYETPFLYIKHSSRSEKNKQINKPSNANDLFVLENSKSHLLSLIEETKKLQEELTKKSLEEKLSDQEISRLSHSFEKIERAKISLNNLNLKIEEVKKDEDLLV